MLKKYKIALILLLILSTYVFAQTDFINRFYGKTPTEKFLVKQWNSDNGLPQNSVNGIVQTKDGYLWFATFDGLVRFDGTQFVIYNQSNTKLLKSNRIAALSADSNGGLWIGAENGQILKYERYKFKDYTEKLNNNKYEIFYISAKDSNNIYIATNKDYVVCENAIIKHYAHRALYTGNHIFNIIKDAGQIKILSNLGYDIIRNDSLKIFNNIVLQNLSLVNGYTPQKNWFNSILKIAYSQGPDPIKLQRKNSLKMNLHINDIFIDSQKRIWVATREGLVLETKKGEFRFNNENLNGEIYKIFEDSFQNIWVGTATKGLTKLSPRSIFSISLKNGIFNDVLYPILQRKNGELWVGSNGGGLVRIKENSINYFSQKNGLLNTSIWALFEDSNKRLWVGSYGGGLFYWTGKKFKKFALWDSLKSKSVFAIFEDSKSGLWIGTDDGLHYYLNNKLIYYSENDGLSDNWIRAITEGKDGTIWLATDNGLTYFKNNKFHKLKMPSGYKMYNFRSLYIDKSGRLWAGTYGQGLYSYFKGKVNVIKKENGLFDNVVSTILEDKFGNFWMTSNHGLYRVARKNLLAFINGKINEIFSIVYQKDDGFLTNEFNGGQMPSSWILKDGTQLFPSFGGLVAVAPNLGRDTAKYHRVYIDKVIVNGKRYNGSNTINIPSSNNNLTFHLSIIEFNKPTQIRLRYKIENLINYWTDIPNIHTINFADISPGKYRLILEEKSGLGDWHSVNSRIKFFVHANFYQTIWFYLLLAILLVTTIFILVQLRIRSLKKRNVTLAHLVKERTQKIETEKENTLSALKEVQNEKERVDNANKEKTDLMRIVAHDLKNPISAINGSVDLIISDASDVVTVKELANIIKNATSESLEMITQFLNQSEVEDPRYKLEIESTNIVNLLKSIIYDNKIIAERKGQSLLFDYSGKDEVFTEIDENKIASVLNNLISNAIKYSPKNKEIKITFENLHDNIKICVIDNGPGLADEDYKKLFSKFAKLSARPTGNETSTGLGLSIVKKIVELHTGKVGVESTFGKGCNFFIIIPKKQK